MRRALDSVNCEVKELEWKVNELLSQILKMESLRENSVQNILF